MKVLLFVHTKKRNLLVQFLFLFIGYGSVAFAQTPTIQWQKTIGGSEDDLSSHSLINTSDGNIVVGGVIGSKDGDGEGGHGGKDLLVMKMNTTGSVVWKKLLGGMRDERGTFLLQARDGSIIVGGTTLSSDGDVTSNRGGSDVWILKLESSTGTIRWQKTLGGSGNDELVSVRENASGEIVIGGSMVTKSSRLAGESSDFLAAKLTGTGMLLWQKSFGGTGIDRMNQLQATMDGGFIAIGMTSSKDGQIVGFKGGYRDAWLIKADANGNLKWQRPLGGTGDDFYCAVQVTMVSGVENYVVAVRTDSNDGDVSGNHGWVDIWVAKLSGDGKQIVWRNTFGGPDWDELGSIKPTKDGGFIIGTTTKTSSNDNDACLIKIDAKGNFEWQTNLGGSASDEIMYFQQTTNKDGTAEGYIVNVFAQSKDGNIPNFHGILDVGLVKLNLQGGLQWARCFGGSKEEWPLNRESFPYNHYFTTFAIAHDEYQLQAADGNYMFLTSTTSNDGDVQGLHYSARTGLRYDNWLVKVAPPAVRTTQAVTRVENHVWQEEAILSKAFPNPFTHQTTIQFTAMGSGKTTIDLYDANGKKVRTVFNGNVVAGRVYSVDVQGSTLPKGIYLYTINNRSQLSERLIKN
jgi:hypothetical protein